MFIRKCVVLFELINTGASTCLPISNNQCVLFTLLYENYLNSDQTIPRCT